jgi:hypothetical protein
MGDLVERLRATYTRWNNPPSPELPTGAGVCLEAADEIARLREALRQIWDVSADRSAHPDDRAREWVEVRARAALAEDDTPGEKDKT